MQVVTAADMHRADEYLREGRAPVGTLDHLLPKLRDADAAGQLRARFTVMPAVNPLGMQPMLLRHHIGRYDLASGINHNRRWPDLFAMAGDRIGPLRDDCLLYTSDAADE